MKIYNLKRKQFLPITLSEAWDYFSSPANLSDITPDKMDFKILYNSGERYMYAGQIICYKVRILPGIRVNWTTEITHVSEGVYFIDEQRFGPYALWHHEHRFNEVAGGIEMIDEVNYAIPFGWLGRLANLIFVSKEVNAIFDHRYKILERYFSNNNKAEIENKVWKFQ